MADSPARAGSVPGGAPDGPAAGRSVVEMAAHLATLGAVLLTAFALLKCYAVAHFSLTTGSALLTTAPLSVLLGTVMSYAYWTLPLGALALCWLAWLRRQHGGGAGEQTALVLAALVAAALSPIVPMVTTTIAFLLVLGVAHGQRAFAAVAYRGGATRPAWWTAWRHWSWRPHAVATFFGVSMLVVFFWTLTRAWIPVELVTVRVDGDERVMVGNVLDTRDSWTTVMRAGDRGLSRVRSDDVLSRQLCHLDGAQPGGQAPIYWLLSGREYASPNRSCQDLVADRDLSLVAGSLPG